MCLSYADISSRNFDRKLVPKQLSKANKDQLFSLVWLSRAKKFIVVSHFQEHLIKNISKKEHSDQVSLLNLSHELCRSDILFSIEKEADSVHLSPYQGWVVLRLEVQLESQHWGSRGRRTRSGRLTFAS